MKYEIMNFNDMSKAGLIWKINKEILHPLGLALFRDAETGTSGGCIIMNEAITYREISNVNNIEKYNTFIKQLKLKEN